MEEEEKDDEGGDGAVSGLPLVTSDVEEPKEKRKAHTEEREKQKDQEVDENGFESFTSLNNKVAYLIRGSNRGR